MYKSLLKTFLSGSSAESSRVGRETGFIFRFARGKLPAPAVLCALLTVFFLLPFAVRSAESSETPSYCESQYTRDSEEECNSFLGCVSEAVKQRVVGDCTTLAALYDSAGGENWTNSANWKTEAPLEQWYGVSIESSTGRVSSLDLSKNNLSGTIPDLSNLGRLGHLVLFDNNLSGTIPALNGFVQLKRLHLSKNSLSGTIPDLSGLIMLEQLDIDYNNLGGTIPDLSSLGSLKAMYLGHNSLSGTIPDLSALTDLKRLHLSRNSLSGTVPDLSSLTDLNWFDLSRNSLSGTVPDLSSLTELDWFDLSGNNLSGTIPDLSALAGLSSVYLDGNGFTGTVSASSFPTQSLLLLDLSDNSLSGTVPDLSSITTLNYLHLNDNGFTGAIPSGLGSAVLSLVGLDLSDNRLSGAMPAMQSSNLAYLYLHNNSLSGTIPDLNLSEDLVELGLWGNPTLSGSITLHPSVSLEIVDRAALLALYDTNGGSGWTSKANWVSRVDLGDWHGVTTEDEWAPGPGYGERVTGLDLSGNGLTGEISNSLEALDSLTTLNLSNNSSLSGTLPSTLSGLTSLNTCGTSVTVPSNLQSVSAACN